MVTRVRYRKEGISISKVLSKSVKNKWILFSIVVIIIGAALFAYAETYSYTYYNQIPQEKTFLLTNNTTGNYTFSTVAFNSTNLKITSTEPVKLHYELYTISVYEHLGVTVTSVSLVKSGNVTTNDTILIAKNSSNYNYYMLVHVDSPTPVNVTLNAVIIDEIHHYGLQNLGFGATAVLFSGIGALAVLLTREFRTK